MDTLNWIAEFFGLRTILTLALVFVPLEWLFSLYEHRKVWRLNLRTDLIYVFLVGHIIHFGNLVVVVAILVAVDYAVPSSLHAAIQSQPLILQLVETMILADIFQYLAHRAFHAVPFLWRFHAVHHSSEQLHWLSAFRVHPVDQIATKAVSLLPVFVLGFSNETLAIYAVIQQFHAIFVHANVKLNLGPLNWVLVTPQFHHWHHARERSAHDKNFAAQFPLIDWIGGTMSVPEGKYPDGYGADGAPPTDNVIRQLVDPFIPERPAGPHAADESPPPQPARQR